MSFISKKCDILSIEKADNTVPFVAIIAKINGAQGITRKSFMQLVTLCGIHKAHYEFLNGQKLMIFYRHGHKDHKGFSA